MLPASSGATDDLTGPRDPAARWATSCWLAACEHFEDQRLAGAAVVLRAAGRILLTGAGVGLDAARFGALALQEAGFEAQAGHAADLAEGGFRLQPGDTLLGIDTGRRDVPAALSRARELGLQTLGLTDRDLTLIDPDVLLYYVEPSDGLAPDRRSPLPVCAMLSMLVARAEPAARLAFDATTFHTQIERLAAARVAAAQVADRLAEQPGRLVIGSMGPSTWVAESIARRINRLAPGPAAATAVVTHLRDLSAPGWQFRPDDILITLEPAGGEPPEEYADSSPALHWRIGGARGAAGLHTRLNLPSPTLASLGMAFVLELLLDELAAR